MSLLRLSKQTLSRDLVDAVIAQVSIALIQSEGIESAFLFGSAAWGDMHIESDIDICAVFKTVEFAEKARSSLFLRGPLSKKIPLDLLLIDRSTFDKKKKLGGIYALIAAHGRQIIQDGKVAG